MSPEAWVRAGSVTGLDPSQVWNPSVVGGDVQGCYPCRSPPLLVSRLWLPAKNLWGRRARTEQTHRSNEHGALPSRCSCQGPDSPSIPNTPGGFGPFHQRECFIELYDLGRVGLHILDTGKGNMPYRVTAVTDDVWQGLPRVNTRSLEVSHLPD